MKNKNKEAILALLKELCSGEGIIENLRILGIKGLRGDCNRCPIAQYIRMHGFDDMSVTYNNIIPNGSSLDGFALPSPIKDFIYNFERYASLVQKRDTY